MIRIVYPGGYLIMMECNYLLTSRKEQAREVQRVADEAAEKDSREKEKAEAVEDEIKKDKLKLLPIPQRLLTSSLSIHKILPTVLTGLHKGSYVELYWCTLIGMHKALSKPN